MRMFAALFAAVLLLSTVEHASAWGYRSPSYSSHRGYSSHGGRGETCCRTNRQTKARFRIW